MIWVEITLDSPEGSDPVSVEDLIQQTSLVYKALDSKYHRVYAFCVRDRRSTSSYTRKENYQYSELTGWGRYLMNSSRYTMHKQFQGRLQYQLGSSDPTFLGCKSYVTLYGLLLLDHL